MRLLRRPHIPGDVEVRGSDLWFKLADPADLMITFSVSLYALRAYAAAGEVHGDDLQLFEHFRARLHEAAERAMGLQKESYSLGRAIRIIEF